MIMKMNKTLYGIWIVVFIKLPAIHSIKESIELIKVIDVIISSENSLATVNFIDSATNSAKQSPHYDFVAEIFKTIGSRFSINDISTVLEQKTNRKRWFFNLIMVTSLLEFQKIISKFSHNNFDYSGYYIILFVNAKSSEVHQIFQILWDHYIYNVNLVRSFNNSVIVETFMPFSSKGCNNTEPMEIAKFSEQTFQTRPKRFFTKKFRNFHKCGLNVTTFETIGPAVLKQDYKNGSYRLHGRDIDILHTVAEKLNFSPIIFYNTTYGAWGVMNDNGSATGAFNEAKLRITDIAFGNLNLKVERAIYLGYTLPYASDIFVFIVPPGRSLSSFQKLLRPFDNFVWISLSIIFGIGFVAIAFLETQCKKQVKNFVFGTKVDAPHMNFLIAIFGGSQRQLPKGNFARFILMTFLLFCLVMRALYQGSLYEFLQSDDSEKEPQTIEEMAQRNYSFYMISSYADFSKENVYMEGRKKVINAEYIKKLMVQILNSSFHGTLMLKMSQVVYSNKERSQKNEQLYRVCKEFYMSVPISMYFPKNSYLVDLFNDLILLFHQAGLMSYWTSVNEDMKFLNVKPRSGEPKKLTVDHLSGPFKIWIGACVISIFVFVGENIWHRKSHLLNVKHTNQHYGVAPYLE